MIEEKFLPCANDSVMRSSCGPVVPQKSKKKQIPAFGPE
jgi:hypothetical protein